MVIKRCLAAIGLCVVVAVLPCVAPAQPRPDRTVVVLLYDGWAPALLERIPAPALERIRKEGAWTHHLVPAFPSISLINQVTVSTGCWPAHHGIVTNVFLDPQRGEYDHSHDADWLTGCEHLHQVAERQGVRAAALGWVGRYSTTRGDLASIASKERQFADFPQDPERTEQIIALLRLPDAQRPRLILGYLRGPDGVEHFSGMESEETRKAVIQSDASVGAILDAIMQLPFHDQVTLIVTTDHGMMPVSTIVNITKILLNHGIDAQALSTGTTSFLYFADRSKVDAAFAALSGYAQFDVVRREAQPPDWHLGTSARVGDLVVSAHPPYFIEDIKRWPSWLQWIGRWGPEFLWAKFSLKATHGYPPQTPGMDGILYAWGAGIAPGRELHSMRNIDIHPTLCRLLGIEPGVPVDGAVATELLQ